MRHAGYMRRQFCLAEGGKDQFYLQGWVDLVDQGARSWPSTTKGSLAGHNITRKLAITP
jgi:hypothetical protein